MKNDEQFKQLINKVESVDNILVTVSHDPSVDELTAALALSLALNQLKKRSVAVFSGQIPSVMKFLNPEKTFESNADSLRDFIISISKDKADRLRVRPEGDFVKVYITPYRSTITKDDLQFSEGDFNVQLVVAFGVTDQDDLDASIASHGRIFHNAVAATINLSRQADKLGTISVQDIESGCYSVSCYRVIKALDSGKRNLISPAVATALLTGIVSATDQFRNNVTSPNIMTVSAELMTKGADPQLVSSELEGKESSGREPLDDKPSNDISDNASLSFSREQTPPPVPESHDESNSKYETKPVDDKRYTLDSSSSTSAPEHLDSPVERRLWQDAMAVNEENSSDALKAAQAQLAEHPANAGRELKEPEVIKPTPAAAPEPTTSSSSTTSTQPSPKSEPEILSVTPMSGQASHPANDARYNGPSVSTPPLNVPQSSKPQNGLPFNEPNQVSPIRPIFNNTPTTVNNLPMPPEPPRPVASSQLAGMPPAANTAPTATTAQQSAAPIATNPAPKSNDPAQFVIPGR